MKPAQQEDKTILKQPKNNTPSDQIRGNNTTANVLFKIIDNIKDGCQIIDSEYRYVYVNKSVIKQGQSNKNELIGHTMIEVYPGIEKTEMFRHLKACMENKTAQTMENDFKFPNGQTGWFELRMEPVAEGVIIFSNDITEKKKLSDALKTKTESLKLVETQRELEKSKAEAILSNIGEGLVAVDNNRKVMVMNHIAEELLGWKAKELIGKDISQTLRLEDGEGNIVPLQNRPTYLAISTGKVQQTNYFFVRKNKTKFPIAITGTPVKLGKEVIGAVNIFRDVTRELEIDRAKSEFVSLASHQLRTPLGISKWYLEAIQEEHLLDKAPDTLKHYIDEVYKNNERLLTLVRDLLSVSRIDQGKIDYEKELINVEEELSSITKEMSFMAKAAHIDLKIEFLKKISPFLIDRIKFREVVENFISNGIKYNDPHGKVKITVDKVRDNLHLSIKDNGIGISHLDLKSLFTKFFRSKAATIKNPEGTGLGLYVAKSYIDSWGGSVTVQSTESKGTEFLINVPLIYQNERNKK